VPATVKHGDKHGGQHELTGTKVEVLGKILKVLIKVKMSCYQFSKLQPSPTIILNRRGNGSFSLYVFSSPKMHPTQHLSLLLSIFRVFIFYAEFSCMEVWYKILIF
jgi:hypothetical protein